jgi:hypothetical protein
MVFAGFCALDVMVSFQFCKSLAAVQTCAQGMSCETQKVFGSCIVPSPLPNSNPLKQLRIASAILVFQELQMALLEIFHIPSIPPGHLWPLQGAPGVFSF